MSDKNIYINDLIHRFPGHTFTETVVGSMTKVTFKDAGLVTIGEQKKLLVSDAYLAIRLDLLEGLNPAFLSTTSERDALIVDPGTELLNITVLINQIYTGSEWLSVGGETGGIVQLALNSVQTTDNTETAVKTLPLDDDTVYLIVAKVVGEKPDHTVTATFIIACTAKRVGGGAASIEGGTTITHSGKGSGAGAWSVEFTLSGNDLRVSVTGQNGMTIDWEASVNYLKF